MRSGLQRRAKYPRWHRRFFAICAPRASLQSIFTRWSVRASAPTERAGATTPNRFRSAATVFFSWRAATTTTSRRRRRATDRRGSLGRPTKTSVAYKWKCINQFVSKKIKMFQDSPCKLQKVPFIDTVYLKYSGIFSIVFVLTNTFFFWNNRRRFLLWTLIFGFCLQGDPPIRGLGFNSFYWIDKQSCAYFNGAWLGCPRQFVKIIIKLFTNCHALIFSRKTPVLDFSVT